MFQCHVTIYKHINHYVSRDTTNTLTTMSHVTLYTHINHYVSRDILQTR